MLYTRDHAGKQARMATIQSSPLRTSVYGKQDMGKDSNQCSRNYAKSTLQTSKLKDATPEDRHKQCPYLTVQLHELP